jgi:hypothetical protein
MTLTMGILASAGAGLPSELKLLLGFEGADGSTSFIDESLSAHSVSRVGSSPVISDDWAASGETSLHIPTRHDRLSIADSADFAFGTAAFAVGGWVKLSNTGEYRFIMGQRPTGVSPSNYWSIIAITSNAIEARFRLSDSTLVELLAGSLDAAEHHIMVTRNASGKFRLRLDGVMIASNSSHVLGCADSGETLCIGANDSDIGTDGKMGSVGYFDDVFVVNGIDPWDTDADITPPYRADFYGVSITGNPPIASDSGFYGVGDTLTATAAPYFGLGVSLSWQWLRDGADIGGETGASYILTSGDLGANISVRQSVSGSLGSAQATSASVGPVVNPTYQDDTRIAGADTRIAGADTRIIRVRIA